MVPTDADRLHMMLAEVMSERQRQDEKWGRLAQRRLEVPRHMWMSILMEEVGELAEAFLEQDRDEAYGEAMQVAAVAVTIMEVLTIEAREEEE